MRRMSRQEAEGILKLSSKMESLLKSPQKCARVLKDRITANVFFEASTRTSLSFQTASARLGAKPIVFSNKTSSSAKGESFSDTIRMVDGYADAIVLRHPCEGAAQLASEIARHPVINAGDGANQHPTQALIDLYTIRKLKGKIAGVNVALFGDLLHARAMHSLLFGLLLFKAKVTLVSPKGLSMPPALVREAEMKFKVKIRCATKPDLKNADVLYVCRVQKERYSDKKKAEAAARLFRVDSRLLKSAKKGLAILHPLPKVVEISPEVDLDPRAKYFEQAKNGVPVRMAVLSWCALGKKKAAWRGVSLRFACKNPSCITRAESIAGSAAMGADGVLRCRYCEKPA